MKSLIYKIYALIFNVASVLRRTDKNLVALVSMHNENFNDSLGAVYDVLKKKSGMKFVFITREDLNFSNPVGVVRFFLIQPWKLASAGTVYLNDNFLPMAGLNIHKDVNVVQLWHGEGVFKKFGFAIPQPDEIRKNEKLSNEKLTHVICSSENVKSLYAEAFGVEEEKVYPLGSPRTDYFYKEENIALSKSEVEKLHPEVKGKKIVLYAPTFRGDEEQDKEILDHLDIDKFNKELGDEYVLAVRLHPQIHCDNEKLNKVINLTAYPDMRQLVLACDICVTDYSSVCMSFSMINKKCIFYAYDLDYYKGSRDFYFDYEQYVPGKIATDMNELIEAIKENGNDEKNEKFRNFNFDHFDGRSAERVVEMLHTCG